MNSMEEDIMILETECYYLEELGYLRENNHFIKFNQALKNLIKAYKELEEERQIVGMPVRNKRDGRIGIVLHQWKSGSVAVLESINPRVINTHDSWNTLEIVTDEVKQTQTKCETIPVSLVEETIEELIKEGRHYNANKIEVLQELLERLKDKTKGIKTIELKDGGKGI